MINLAEQFSSNTKAGFDAAVRFATFSMEATEKLVDFQVTHAKAAFSDALKTSRALAEAKDASALVDLKSAVFEPTMEKTTGYMRGFYELTAATQADFNRMLEEQISEFNRQVVALLDKAAKNGPAGSDLAVAAMKSALAAANSAYDNMSKVSRQAVEIAEANMTSMTEAAKKKAA